jgi:hypothetical protein
VSLSRGDEVPHIFTRKPRPRPAEFSVTSAKRLLQQNRPLTSKRDVRSNVGSWTISGHQPGIAKATFMTHLRHALLWISAVHTGHLASFSCWHFSAPARSHGRFEFSGLGRSVPAGSKTAAISELSLPKRSSYGRAGGMLPIDTGTDPLPRHYDGNPIECGFGSEPEEFCSHRVLLEPQPIQLSVRRYTHGQFNKPKGNFHSSLIEAIALVRPTSSATELDFFMNCMQGRKQ